MNYYVEITDNYEEFVLKKVFKMEVCIFHIAVGNSKQNLSTDKIITKFYKFFI